MPAELHILGCGSATPTPGRNPTAQFIRLNQTDILIDCGEGTQIQMLRFRIKPMKIRHVFISHLHGDHYLGLPGLISSMHLMGRKESLTVYGPPELEEILNFQFRVSETRLNFPLHFVQTQTDGKQFLVETGGFKIYSFPLKHRIPCTGFLLQENTPRRKLRPEMMKAYQVPVDAFRPIKDGADYTQADGTVIPNARLTFPGLRPVSYAYCSDTAPDEEVLEVIRGADYLYHEATFLHELLERAQETYHTTAQQAGEIAREAGVGKLFIGHYSSRYRDIKPLQEEASVQFQNTLAVEDGMVIHLLPFSTDND